MEVTGSKDEKIEQLIGQSYAFCKEGDFPAAIGVLEEALAIDFDHVEVVAALKCANFWKEREVGYSAAADGFEKGEYLFAQWKSFSSFLERIGPVSEQCLYALRQFVFSRALQHFMKLYEEQGARDSDLLLRIGTCLKRKGDYENALRFLETAAKQRKEDPEVLAELADCYAMINEERAAKAFFREAFFLSSGTVDLPSLESEMIRRLVRKVREMGYSSPQLEEWIPVYGVIYGVFSVKRELRSIEYGKLKQAIYTMENELMEGKERSPAIVPRLLNRYFWLIDHYMATREDRSRINEVLAKIKQLDASIYQQYIN